MSESITQEPAGRPFEERVMALLLDIYGQIKQLNERVSGLERGLNETRVEIKELNERVAKLEAKQYDTKPIWEQALNEITELRREMVELRQEMHEHRLNTQRGFSNFERKLYAAHTKKWISNRSRITFVEKPCGWSKAC